MESFICLLRNLVICLFTCLLKHSLVYWHTNYNMMLTGWCLWICSLNIHWLYYLLVDQLQNWSLTLGFVVVVCYFICSVIHLFIDWCIDLSWCLPACLFVCLFVYLSLSVCLSMSVCVCLFVCLSVWLFVGLYVSIIM